MQKESLSPAQRLDIFKAFSISDKRQFLNGGNARETYEVSYKYWDSALKLSKVAAGEVAGTSDCFILYIVTCMGFCSAETISDILAAYSSNYKELAIARDSLDKQTLRQFALKRLHAYGFLYKTSYRLDFGRSKTCVTLYSSEREGQIFMGKSLKKTVPVRAWMQASPVTEQIAVAAAAYICGKVSRECGSRLVGLAEEPIKTKELGTAFLPPTAILERDGIRYKCMFIPAYIKKDAAIQTTEDFEGWCVRKVSLIKNYIYLETEQNRDPKNVPLVFVACEDYKDVEAMVNVISQTRVLHQYGDMPYIFFTTEGAFREDAPGGKFLCVSFQEQDGRLRASYGTALPPVYADGG